MKKTQLSQGLFVGTRVLGSCYDRGAVGLRRVVTGRRIERKGTARPGSIWRIDSGEAAKT